MKKVLFLCKHNSARSQMAEGLLRGLYGNEYEAFSAGSIPSRVNPCALRAMTEIGMDISGQRSKSIEEFRGEEFDYVVTLCDEALEACPFFRGKKMLHKGFKDPSVLKGGKDEILTAFRQLRDEIRKWIEEMFGRD